MSVRNLVLASQSPRRRQILTISGYEFDILPSQISEILDENLNLTSQIRQVASDKAEACLKMGKTPKGHGFLVLASDTVVILGDQILGKPKDENEARSFLSRLSNQTHDVITAISLIDVDTDRRVQDHAVTRVRFRKISDQEIDAYVATGDPMDKAGAYGIQSAIGNSFIASVEGEYDTVAGLSMTSVEKAFLKLGVIPKKRISHIGENVNRVLTEIENACLTAKRDRELVRLVAVSKTKPAIDVVDAWLAGQRIFAENYAQEALPKILEVAELLKYTHRDTDEIVWHFIGVLQSNKIKQIVGHFSLIHSVDRISHLEEIEKRASEKNLVQPCLLQLNIADESTKAGANRNEFFNLLETAQKFPHLKIQGIMALPPIVENVELTRQRFADIRKIFDQARASLPVGKQTDFKELSMGTTSDYREAILEGATLVRVGTSIFGSRQ